MSSRAADPSAVPAAPSGPIVARAGTYYRRTRYILALAMLIYAGLSIRDGFFAWPPIYQREMAAKIDRFTHSQADILLNQILGVLLPFLAVALLAWMFYRSRGEYRLDGNTLSIPGHPPMSLDAIDSIDKTRWDRKGIAKVTYHASNGKAAFFVMDDFLYQQTPTDEIFKQMEAALLKPKAAKAPAAKVAAIPAPPRPTRTPPRPRMG